MLIDLQLPKVWQGRNEGPHDSVQGLIIQAQTRHRSQKCGKRVCNKTDIPPGAPQRWKTAHGSWTTEERK